MEINNAVIFADNKALAEGHSFLLLLQLVRRITALTLV
jgi:hypothetical protein